MVVSQGLSSGRSYEKVAKFKLIWWDKGSGSKIGVSIWHPIVSPGCAMLGDLAVQG
jgi:vacuolar protein sorting-associated protein 13A/C